MSNNHDLATVIEEQGAWWADAWSAYIIAGGLPAVPSSSLTLAAFATDAMVQDTAEMIYVTQISAPITLTDDPLLWIAIDRSTTRTVTGWTREGTTHYIFQANATQPATPAGSLTFAKITVAGSVVTEVLILPNQGPAFLSDALQVVSIQAFGGVGDGDGAGGGTDNTTPITNAIAAAGSLYFPDGIYEHSGTIDWRRPGGGLQVNTQSRRGVRFHHTGTGVAHTVDGGTIAASIDNYGLVFGPCRITGNNSTTDAWSMTNTHAWDIDLVVNNVTGACFRSKFAIGGRLKIEADVNPGLQTGPLFTDGVVLDGNGRIFNGKISDGVTNDVPGDVLEVIGSIGNSALIVVGMVVTGVGVTPGTTVIADTGGGGTAGTYQVDIIQGVGGAGITMSDNGVTGPTNAVILDNPRIRTASVNGVSVLEARENTIETPECESNVNFNVFAGATSRANVFRNVISNGKTEDQGRDNVWINMVEGGTLSFVGALQPSVFGGICTTLTLDNSTVRAYIRGIACTTFTNNSVESDAQVKEEGLGWFAWNAPYPSFTAPRITGKVGLNHQELTASGAFLADSRALQVNNNSSALVCTWSGAIAAGEMASIINASTVGGNNHSIQLPAGATFQDGVNNTVFLDALAEGIWMVAMSTTQWFVLSETGAPVFGVT